MNCVAYLMRHAHPLCLFSRQFLPRKSINALRPPIYIFLFSDISENLIILMWKILNFVGYEFYRFCAENSYIQVASGVA
jgi:hypothetical protein